MEDGGRNRKWRRSAFGVGFGHRWGDAIETGVESTPTQGGAALAAQAAPRLVAQTASAEGNIERLNWADDLLDDILSDAEERHNHFTRTGRPVVGYSTGLGRLDALTGGLEQGLHILTGSAGVGKTILALQIARTLARQVPVLYLTFGASPASLVLRSVSSQAGVSPLDIRRGLAHTDSLRFAVESWGESARNIAFVRGDVHLTLNWLQGRALYVMNRVHGDNCVVVVDDLQGWAKVAAELAHLPTPRERIASLAAGLHQLSLQLECPVLALSESAGGTRQIIRGNSGPVLDLEARDLEAQADVFFVLAEATKHHILPPGRLVYLAVTKNRNGERGEVELVLRPDTGSVQEYVPDLSRMGSSSVTR